MLTDEQIRASALEMYANGVMPSVRKVEQELGGGDRNRICRILREMSLPRISKQPAPRNNLPTDLASAIEKHGKAEYERGKADGLKVAEEYKQANALLVAQNAELKACMAEMQAVSRAASPRQMRTIVEEVLCDFLGEVRPTVKSRRNMPPEKPKKMQKSGPAPDSPLRDKQVIDGMKTSDIYRTRLELLTPAQAEWKRYAIRQYTLAKKRRSEDVATGKVRHNDGGVVGGMAGKQILVTTTLI